MNDCGIYEDIAKRTGGEIYIGVVGPVRTGKSTFIKRFMETLVLPNIDGDYDKEKARDELPQSAQGRMVMTTEPKFIPDEAVTVAVDDNATFKVRMIDCVGFTVPDALGSTENGAPRMVHTPWSEEPVPFDVAAETGTQKVISDHCTIAMLVTTDGTIGEIPRENYIEAEEKTVKELKAHGKPFVVILNTADPHDQQSSALAYSLEEKYDSPVALVNCLDLDAEDIKKILEMILLEFPAAEIDIDLPEYLGALGYGHPINESIRETAFELAEKAEKIKDVKNVFAAFTDNENVDKATVADIDLGSGKARIMLDLSPDLYFAALSEISGCEIRNDKELFTAVKEMNELNRTFKKYEKAIVETEDKGYGIASPSVSEMKLHEPEIVKQPGGYGVRIRASAESVHMLKIITETEINPVVGTEQQSNDLIRYLTDEYSKDPLSVWKTNMFGKTLKELVDEGMAEKSSHLPDDTRKKFAETIQRVINEGASGMICILL